MLEALVSSRIRRALLEHILTHPHERFYLRGLAKELDLSVSPLRRELKRLQETGMLTAAQEGNMLFYAVNVQSAPYRELSRAGAAPAAAPHPSVAETEIPQALRTMPAAEPVAPQAPARPEAAPQVRPPRAAAFSGPLRGPALVGVSGLGMILMLTIAGTFYLKTTDPQQLAAVRHRLTAGGAPTAVVHEPSSGRMRGERWHIVGGGFGAFLPAGDDQEAF